MSLTKKQEAYAQAVASGMDKLDAMSAANYKAKNKENALRQLKNLDSNENVQNRITELKAIAHIQSGEPTDDIDDADVEEIVSALQFFQSIYKNKAQPLKARISCAAIAIEYEQAKPAAIGKKEGAVLDAKTATKKGRFATLSNQPDMLEHPKVQ